MSVKYIDHTADVGLQIQAKSVAECFSEAAQAMFDLIVDIDQIKVNETELVDLEASSLARLMRLWLEELLFLHEVDEMLFSLFEISSLTETHLQARVSGERVDPKKHRIKAEIKAVTYHQLIVESRGSEWFCQIIFDL